MIRTEVHELANGTRLHCRASGPDAAPVLLFLHGFPEGAFAWDGLLERFGARYRCLAPNLRGYAPSSAPSEPEAYRARHLVGDIGALIERLGGAPVEALVAHDWGGAIAWGIAAQRPEWIRRLVIVNSPHPATFLRDLQHDPRQQAASAYMNFLCRPDAERLLAENDFARMWPLFTRFGAADAGHPGGAWLTEERRAQYRAQWGAGLTGPCNYYRASPVRPATAQDRAALDVVLPRERLVARVPTLVVWGERDGALLPGLLDGLDAYVPELRVVRVAGASHWIVHEHPSLVAAEIERHLS